MQTKNNLFFRKPFKYTYFNATLMIIGINCIVFALCYIFPAIYSYVRFYGALNVVLVDQYHMFWQFISYMFVHSNVSHLFFNMLALLIFGFTIERAIGSKEFLLYYFICVTFGVIFS